MRLFSIRGCVIRVHPLFPLMLLIMCFGGAPWAAAAFLATLFLHESAHFLQALKLQLPISQIELTPFGGSMQIPLIDTLTPRQHFLLSSAGPACNALFLIPALFISWRYAIFHPFLLHFIECHAVMLCINLLPVLPLDGGRMLLSLLSRRMERHQVLRVLLIAGRIFAVALILAGTLFSLCGRPRLSLILLGLYLLYAAAIEEKTSTARYLASFMARRIRFEKHMLLPVHMLCVSASMPVFMLIAHLRPGAYHIVTVVEDVSSLPIGQLHEAALLSALLTCSNAPLGDLCTSRP
ncbi:MAG: hypothetical protein IKM26_00155 [Clostridia bacterium]|nr:hypothetical protein [Clostridia bacterium]